MPELPEVETVVRDLRPLLCGRKIVSIHAGERRLRQPWNPSWEKLLCNQVIDSIRRRGKWIIVDLNSGVRLVVHLGMTGQLTVVPREEKIADHVHLLMDLDNEHDLRFRDVRRFGGCSVFADDLTLQGFFTAQQLGPEPFELDVAPWRKSLSRTSRPIKAVLLDQTIVAGVGNIYADESLFVARLHPTKRANQLTGMEANRLLRAISSVLRHAIDKRGSTIRNYVGGSGLSGGYQNEFRVYGLDGHPCRRCKTPIAVLRIGGRASHFCPSCQKAD